MENNFTPELQDLARDAMREEDLPSLARLSPEDVDALARLMDRED